MSKRYKKYKESSDEGIIHVLKELEISLNVHIQTFLSMGFIPFETIKGTSILYGIADVNTQQLEVTPIAKSSYKGQIEKRIGEVMSSSDFDAFLIDIVHIQLLTQDPFRPWGFYMDDDEFYSKKWNLNNVLYSRYYRELKPIVGDEDVSLLLKLYRLGDSNTFYNFSYAEIIMAWILFHDTKVMNVLSILGYQGGGKTFMANLSEYLYSDSSHHDYSAIIDMSDAKSMEWGNVFAFIKVAILDDVPDRKEIIEKVTSDIKSTATSLKQKTVSIKGSGMIRVNSYNQIVTTNFIKALPVEDGDRRVYPIRLDKDLLTSEDEQRIIELDMPMVGDRRKYYPIIQKLLNHFLFIYEQTKDDKLIYHHLMKYAPSSKFKDEVISLKATRSKRIKTALSSAISLPDAYSRLADMFAMESNQISEVFSQLPVDKLKRDDYSSMFIGTTALKQINALFGGNKTATTNQIVGLLFNGLTMKSYRYGNSNTPRKAIKIPMKKLKETLIQKPAKEILADLKNNGKLIFE